MRGDTLHPALVFQKIIVSSFMDDYRLTETVHELFADELDSS